MANTEKNGGTIWKWVLGIVIALALSALTLAMTWGSTRTQVNQNTTDIVAHEKGFEEVRKEVGEHHAEIAVLKDQTDRIETQLTSQDAKLDQILLRLPRE